MPSPSEQTEIGTPVPRTISERMSRSLRGRLLLRFWSEACGAAHLCPSTRSKATYFRRIARTSPRKATVVSEFMRACAWQKPFKLVSAVDPQAGLRRAPPDFDRSASVLILSGCAPDLPSECLALAIHRTRATLETHTVYLLEENFPDSVITCLAVEHEAGSNPRIVLYNGEDISDSEQWNDTTRIALQSLASLLADKGRFHLATPEEAKSLNLSMSAEPPKDPTLTKLLTDLHFGRVAATRATVASSLVTPHDATFLSKISVNIEDLVVEQLQKGARLELLLWWDGRRYVMSDDYHVYAAYRHLRESNVPAVVLGPLGPTTAVLEKGGAELLPKVGVSRGAISPDVADFNRRVARSPDVSEGYARLHILFMRLASMVHSDTTMERELQEVIQEHAQSVHAYGTSVHSEVRLGSDYRIDLVVRLDGGGARTQLIELERASHKLFTKSGRFRAAVTHAIQQVEDWLAWIIKNPVDCPDSIDPTLPLEGTVVVGRKRDLTANEQDRLAQNNRDKRIKVITYDDLLDRIELLLAAM